MKNRFFWGAPVIDMDTRAFEKAILQRAARSTPAELAAVTFVEKALDRVTSRSQALLQVQVILVVLTMVFGQHVVSKPAASFHSLLTFAFVLALLSCIILLPNLAAVWFRNPEKTFGDPHEEFAATMKIVRMRSARFMVALVLSIAAFILVLVSLTTLAPMAG